MTPLLPTETSASLVNTVHLADCLELCERVYRAGIKVDCIAADLPYESLEIGWDKLIPVKTMWAAFRRIIHPQGAIVLTAKQPFSSLLITSNLKQYRYSWYWEKARGANAAQTSYRPLAVVEEVLVFSLSPAVFSVVPTIRYYPQGEKLKHSYSRVNKPNHQKIINNSAASPMRNPERGIGVRTYEYNTPRSLIYFGDDVDRGLHPTQKPVDLFRYLIRTYTLPNELVFDPTCGSGTTAVAAREEGRRYIVGDSSSEYVGVTNRRLDAPYTPSFMPALEAITA